MSGFFFLLAYLIHPSGGYLSIRFYHNINIVFNCYSSNTPFGQVGTPQVQVTHSIRF